MIIWLTSCVNRAANFAKSKTLRDNLVVSRVVRHVLSGGVSHVFFTNSGARNELLTN